jgi:hypothetical protein
MSEDLIVAETLKTEIFTIAGGIDSLLDRLERDVRAVRTDISTRDGRAAISSLAFKVSRSKTALDELGKNLVADWKARSALVDADRRRMRERLDALRDEVRKPLTEWEDAEKSRINCHEIALSGIQALVRFDVLEPHPEDVQRRLDQFEEMSKSPREWHEFAKRANETCTQVHASLIASLDAALRRNAERAELARLRSEAEKQAQRERDERLQHEAAEAARKQAEAVAAEAARVTAAREAAERARINRERVAAEEARLKAEASVMQAEENARRDAETAVENERKRVADEQAAAAAEKAQREADERHRAAVHEVIAGDLMRRGLSKNNARVVVNMLATGEVPYVRIEY